MRCLLQFTQRRDSYNKEMFPFRPVLLICLILIIMICISCSPQLTRTITRDAKPTSSSCGTLPSGQAMPLGDIPGWHQVFADDFSGTTLNTSNWYPYSGQPGGGFGRVGGSLTRGCR